MSKVGLLLWMIKLVILRNNIVLFSEIFTFSRLFFIQFIVITIATTVVLLFINCDAHTYSTLYISPPQMQFLLSRYVNLLHTVGPNVAVWYLNKRQWQFTNEMAPFPARTYYFELLNKSHFFASIKLEVDPYNYKYNQEKGSARRGGARRFSGVVSATPGTWMATSCAISK